MSPICDYRLNVFLVDPSENLITFTLIGTTFRDRDIKASYKAGINRETILRQLSEKKDFWSKSRLGKLKSW